MWSKRISALVLIVVGVALAGFIYYSEPASGAAWMWQRPFRLGLDLKGGSRLVYSADTDDLSAKDVPEAMSALRQVIERRINAFGVTEPLIQIEQGSVVGAQDERLVIELPGITNVAEAVKLINRTPTLEFKALDPQAPVDKPQFIPSGVTGRYLKRAQVAFSSRSINPIIEIEFTAEGAERFAAVTKANVGKPLGIFLDGVQLSAPTVNEPITDGRAQISGQFNVDEAKQLTRDLNLGALPVPIKLISTQTIGATLGDEALRAGLQAALIGFALIVIFMILWYRLPGVIAVLALSLYVIVTLTLFKLFGITITAAGIAGLILSLGIAVDANVLIFERLKEELRGSDTIPEAIGRGFKRAWSSIRDSNLSTIISALILFWFGTSFIKGFAVTLIIGVIVSLFTAITVTRIFLLAVAPTRKAGLNKFLIGSGFHS